MTEEDKIFAGLLFCPGDPELRAIKLRSHKLSARFSAIPEDEAEARNAVMKLMLGAVGEGSFMQGPVFFHYGVHTSIGKRFFANYNLTVQDDARVTIGDDCNFGPNVTIVTPIHPLIASERKALLDETGTAKRMCYAKPVRIGSDVWLGANVTVCGGASIGDGCVIGAGSVVVKDIPAGTFAAGNPCRVIREITEADSMSHKPEVLGGCRVPN